MVGADNQAPACRIDNERIRADSLSHARFSLRPWNFSLSRACWIAFAKGLKCPVVPYWNKDPKKLGSFLEFHRLFLLQDLQTREQNQRMMLSTGLGIDEHPTLKGLWAELLESRILLDEQFQLNSKVFRAVGHRILLEI